MPARGTLASCDEQLDFETMKIFLDAANLHEIRQQLFERPLTDRGLARFPKGLGEGARSAGYLGASGRA
jgi:hypothetical protein